MVESDKPFAYRFLFKMINLSEKSIITFTSLIKLTNDCWIWQGYLDSKGYGRFKHKKTSILAHRISYTLFLGVIPDGLCVLHKCDNPKCVNPTHFFLGTRADNIKDRVQKGRSGQKSISSKYVGVSFYKNYNKWKAYVNINSKTIHAGYYDTEEEALEGRIKKAKELNITLSPIILNT